MVALGSLKTWLVKRVVSPMDRVSFRLTGGRLRLTIGRPVLLLSTIGQRTGRVRSTPIFYLRDGTDLVVCNVRPPGERTNPWPRNLDHQPAVEVTVEGRRQRMTARRATQEEIDRLWPRLVRIWPLYADYYQHTKERHIFVSSHREAAQKTPDDDQPLRLSDRQPSGLVSLCATQRGLPAGNDLLDIVKGARAESRRAIQLPGQHRGNNVPTIERGPARPNPSERPKPALGRVGVRGHVRRAVAPRVLGRLPADLGYEPIAEPVLVGVSCAVL